MRNRMVLVAMLAVAVFRGLAPDAHAGGSQRHGVASSDHGPGAPRGADIVSFDAMYGVDGPFVGGANPVRGVPGDELPWAIARSIKGELETNGHLRIRIKGLVFKDDPSVPAGLRGKNDETEFRGLVSCLAEGVSDTPTANVVTQGFPATESGDATIDTVLALPNPCVAPIVMVLAGSEDKWFAIMGFEKESE